MLQVFKTRCLGALIALLLCGPSAQAAQRTLIAPGIEKIVHANGTVEYRQVEVPRPAPESVPPEKPVEEPAITSGTEETGEDGVKIRKLSPPAPAPRAAPAMGKIYKFRDKNGVVTYQSAVPAAGVAYTEFKPKVDCFACNRRSNVKWESTPLFVGRYEDEISRYARRHNVSPSLIKAVIHAESAFNPQARSRVGAQGLMQLMPGTAAELGVTSPFDPAQNIDGGVRYLAMLLKMYNQDMRLATAAYNAGPGAVKKYNGVPAYPETQAYVQRVAILERRYRSGI